MGQLVAFGAPDTLRTKFIIVQGGRTMQDTTLVVTHTYMRYMAIGLAMIEECQIATSTLFIFHLLAQ